MEVKLIEVRDRSTFMPMMAIRLVPESEEERFLLARAGYGRSPDIQGQYILLSKLDGREINYDPYAWGRLSRTCGTVHHWLMDHWAQIKSGDVVDVEFILGETASAKVSERLQVAPSD